MAEKMLEPVLYRFKAARGGWVHIEDATNAPVQGLEPLVTLESALSYAEKREEALRHAGAMLSNCAFNLAQRNPGQFTARDIEALDKCRKAWDEAIRALDGKKGDL